jgi:hypothetical protein
MSSTLPCWSTARHREWVFVVDCDEHLLKVPRVPRAGPPAAQAMGVDLPELAAPLVEGALGDAHPRWAIICSTSRRLSGNR